MDRRDFIKKATMAAAGAAVGVGVGRLGVGDVVLLLVLRHGDGGKHP